MGMKRLKYASQAFKYAKPIFNYAVPFAKNIYSRFSEAKRPLSGNIGTKSRKTVPYGGRKFGKVKKTFYKRKIYKKSYRPKKVKYSGRRMTLKERYTVNGFVSTFENYKTVSDPNTVAVIHSTFSRVGYATTLSSLLARKILNRIGLNPASSQEIINLPAGALIKLIYLDQFLNTSQTVTHTVPASASLQAVASTFYATCVAFFDGNSSYRFTELRYEAGGITLHRLSLDDMVLKIWVQSVLKVQNRTLADDGTSPNTDRVDTNPIHGYAIRCRGGVPQTRIGNTVAQSNMDEITDKGSGYATGGQFNVLDAQPFRRVNFTNGSFEKPVMLKPGQVKSSIISHYFSGDINNIGKLFKVDTNQAETKVRSAPGKCEVMGFEELIRTSESISISVGYEQEVTICMDMFKGKKRAIRIEHRDNAE